MNVHRDKFLVNETNTRTKFQLYWYYDSTCFGQPFCPSSGVLSRTSARVHFADLMTVCYQEQDGTGKFHPAPGSKRSSNLQNVPMPMYD